MSTYPHSRPAAYAASQKRNAVLKAQADKLRAKLLELVPQEFTVKEAMVAWNYTSVQVHNRLEQMVRYGTVVPTSADKTPRTYRKRA